MNTEQGHISQSEWELIENYLLGNLSHQETKDIDHQIRADAAFASKVNEVRDIISSIQEQALSEKLAEWHSQIKETPVIPIQRKSLFTDKRYIVAAAVLLLTAVAAWWLIIPSKEEKLFAEFYKPDPGLPTVMSVSDNYEFDKAMVDYKTKNYDAAIQTWESLLTQYPESDTLLYFIGNAYLANDDAQKSISFLGKATQKSNSIFRSEAYWYLGIAYLKEKKFKDAKSALELSNHDKKDEIISRIPE